MTIERAILVLTEFNDWRRGVGYYQWNDDPGQNKPLPFSATEVGEAIDKAKNALGILARAVKEVGEE